MEMWWDPTGEKIFRLPSATFLDKKNFFRLPSAMFLSGEFFVGSGRRSMTSNFLPP